MRESRGGVRFRFPDDTLSRSAPFSATARAAADPPVPLETLSPQTCSLEPSSTVAQAGMLANRLGKRYRHLRKWARRTGCTAFRLYDRDIPEVPLVLDVYGVPETQDTSEKPPLIAGALFKRTDGPPGEEPSEDEAAWLAAMRQAVSGVLAVPVENIFLRQRERQRGAAQYTKTGTRRVITIVREKEMRFIVNLSDYLDTGLFLDARKIRAWLCGSCAEKRVLNLFCYTGSLSLAAAKGGAAAVDSVDISPTYLRWAKQNFTLNGCAAPRFSFIRADVIRFIGQARAAKRKWDIVILDPPVFSNSKKMTGVFDVRRDHRALIQKCLALLAEDGLLLFGVKRKRFSLDAADFPSARITDVTLRMTDEDFRTNAKNRGKWYVFQKK
jgi:23S rRNA G2069 N7-methylase RlmK/C1962 C5-methylase RlmI